MSTSTSISHTDEFWNPLDIDDISDLRQLPRTVLLAGLAVAAYMEANRRRGDPDDLLPAILSENAWPGGWTLGAVGLGGNWAMHEGIHFTPKELETVVRLCWYFAARETEAAATAEATS